MNSAATGCDATRQLAWIGLTLLPGMGPTRIWQAVQKPPNPVHVWQRLQNRHTAEAAKGLLHLCGEHHISVVTWDDPGYPANLRTMEAPPPVLYVRGCLIPHDSAAVAIVGSRRASPHALQLSFLLARDLAAAGVTVVSGLATGVDGAAHRGALAAGGRTIAVVACGPERVYPPTHTELAGHIAQSGAIVSQFPCGTVAQRGHFPARNRTLAGLALGTLVVEAPEKSGALITARWALEIGRDVMACPGDVLREHTRGSNALLRDGARPVMEVRDVLTELATPLRRILMQAGCDNAANVPVAVGDMPPLPMDVALPASGNSRRAPKEKAAAKGETNAAYVPPPVHTQVWNQLWQLRKATADQLVHCTGMESAAVRSALAELELQGYIQRQPGDIYCLPAPALG